MSTNTYPLPTPCPAPRNAPASRPGPLLPQARLPRASVWAVAGPVMLALLLTSFAAHAQGKPAASEAETCEVCIPADYADACDKAAQDADVYYGEARALQRAHREAEDRATRAAVEKELARREAEDAERRGWWMLAGGAGGSALLLVLVYALAQ